MKIVLEVIDGVHTGRSFEFDGHSTFIVGRGSQAHFQLPKDDRYFSRLHFLIEVNPPLCRLLDLGSRNGTFVNGKRATSIDLNDGDSIKGGRTVIRAKIDATEPPAFELELPSNEVAPAPPIARPKAAPSATACPVCGSAMRAGEELCAGCRDLVRREQQPLPGYEIVRELGRGGMGVVYLARCLADGATVAVKSIAPESAGSKGAVARFLREARILQKLQHPNIVAFREMGEAGGKLFFVMEFIHGADAARLLKEHGPLPVGRAVRLICQLLDALGYAHANGFVHRDIKPGNCLISGAGAQEKLHLCDFGLARVYQDSHLSGLTLKGDMGGTFAFMAPEQITNLRDASPPADIYSAGALLYTLLTAHAIYDFPGEIEKQILMILEHDPVPILKRRLDLPRALTRMIDRALERDPAARFPDALAMKAALLPCAHLN